MYLIPVFVSGNVCLNGIPYFLCCILDSKAQDSGLRKQQFPGFRNPNSLNGATVLKQERLLNMFIVFEICEYQVLLALELSGSGSGDDEEGDDKNGHKEDFTPFEELRRKNTNGVEMKKEFVSSGRRAARGRIAEAGKAEAEVEITSFHMTRKRTTWKKRR